MFWLEKYTPKSFKSPNFVFHNSLKNKCKQVLKEEDHPSICIHGVSGSGKFTLARCMLEDIFGSEIYNLRIKNIAIRNKHIQCMGSNYHFELYGTQYTKLSVEELIKVIHALSDSTQIQSLKHKTRPLYILIRNYHKWDIKIENLLLHTSEKYSDSIRFIITTSKFPRYLTNFSLIRIPFPFYEEIEKWIVSILEQENVNNIDSVKKYILQYYNQNYNLHLSTIITQFEKYKELYFRNSSQLNIYQKNIKALVLFLKEKKIQNYLKIRPILLETILYGKEINVIRHLVHELNHASWISDTRKIEIIHYAANISHRLTLPNIAKTCVHSEAFLLKCFSILL